MTLAATHQRPRKPDLATCLCTTTRYLLATFKSYAWGIGSRPNSGCRMLNSDVELRMPDAELRAPDAELRMPDAELRCRTPDAELRMPDAGL